jgi:hypothetical protein
MASVTPGACAISIVLAPSAAMTAVLDARQAPMLHESSITLTLLDPHLYPAPAVTFTCFQRTPSQ